MNQVFLAAMVLALCLVATEAVIAESSSEEREARKTEEAVEDQRAASDVITSAAVTVEALKEKEQFSLLLPDAKAVLVVPSLFKAGFLVGIKAGDGILMVRNESDDGWSAPAFYRIQAASVGMQVGAELSEVALLIMTDEALQKILGGSIELGAGIDITVASLSGEGAIDTTSDVYTFALSKGVFAGLSLEGAGLDFDEKRNNNYYKQELTAEGIVLDSAIKNGKALPLYRALNS